MVSEIHPFLDGNGRIARVMMNAELVKAEQTRIMIPTVYRDDYLGALRRLTRQQDPLAYIKMLQRAQEFSATLNAGNLEELELQLESSNAFKEHNETKLKLVYNKKYKITSTSELLQPPTKKYRRKPILKIRNILKMLKGR